MNIKDELKAFVQKELGTIASPFLLNRAVTILQTAPDDKNGLIEAINKVGEIIELFIDSALADKTCRLLRSKINESQ